MNKKNASPNKEYVRLKLFALCLLTFSNYTLTAQSNRIEQSSNIALEAVLHLDEDNWQNLMKTSDSLLITFYEEYTLGNIKNIQQKKEYKNQFKSGLISSRQENFLIVYDYLFDRLEGGLSDYKIEDVIGENYYNYSDVYERYFDLHYFASASKLKNINTGNQVVLISNMVFYETNKVIGLSQEEWHKNLILKSFKVVKKLPASDNTNLAYILVVFHTTNRIF